MSAAARAEARRKAILSRGTDRLAKLTTSARGEDAPAYMHDDPPLPNLDSGLRKFVGEESSMPPSRRSPAPPPSFQAAGLDGAPSDPSVWSQEQQQQMLRALMGGGPQPSFPRQAPIPPLGAEGQYEAPADDPLQALMSQMASFQGANATGKAPAGPPLVKPRTRLQKLIPLMHLVTFWSLLAYFVFWKEPAVFGEYALTPSLTEGRWARWAKLGWQDAVASDWGVQFVPFFWAFISLQIALHSLRIFSGFDTVEPPMLLSVVLPHLPAPFPSIIMNGLKYLQMARAFLDDLATLVFGVGFLILLAGWCNNQTVT